MWFVDGTNFTTQAGSRLGVQFDANDPPDKLLQVVSALILSQRSSVSPGADAFRSYWFGSFTDQARGRDYSKRLRDHNLEPVLLNHQKGEGEKGVDMRLAVELLVNSFQQNLDIAVLVAGDADYVPLVQEAKRYGLRVQVAFFDNCSPRLKLVADRFLCLDEVFDRAADSFSLRTAATDLRNRPFRVNLKVNGERSTKLWHFIEQEGIKSSAAAGLHHLLDRLPDPHPSSETAPQVS